MRFGFREICWKLEESKWILLNNSEVSSFFWNIYYFSERLRYRLSKNIQTFNKFSLWKNFSGGSLYTGGAEGIRAFMHFFSSAYFNENIIFGLSKDQTFGIWSTFMYPALFLNLVTHLVIEKVFLCYNCKKNRNNNSNFCRVSSTFFYICEIAFKRFCINVICFTMANV